MINIMMRSKMIFIAKHIAKFLPCIRNRPDFIIVGAQKCGTTSLHAYLDSREGFLGSHQKEVHFFDRDERYGKGEKWYECHFASFFGKTDLFFEASPTYLHRENVPRRLYDYNPRTKIILMLREPVSRAYSAWNMYRQWSEEGFIPSRMSEDIKRGEINNLYKIFFDGKCPSFREYVDIEINLIEKGDTEEEPSLLRRGLYKSQIERYVELFGWDNILVIGFNELKNDSEAVIRKCHEFLGVSYQAPEIIADKEIMNKRVYSSKINPRELEILQEFYEQPNKELFDYLGFQPDW